MNTFKALLLQGSDKIKEQRANNIAQQVDLEMDSLIRNKERELLVMKAKLETMRDFGNETTYSLKIVKDDFSAKEWSEQYLKLVVDIKLVESELKIQKDVYNELFKETSSNESK